MIYDVVAEDALDETVLDAAGELAAKPVQAMAIAKRLLKGDRQAVLDRIDEEVGHFAAQLRSDEAKAAFAAFMARKT